MNTSPPLPKEGGAKQRETKGLARSWRGEASVGTPVSTRNRSTSPGSLAHFWIDDDDKAQLQEAALP